MIASWHSLAIDCPDPSSLATFYEQLLGMQRLYEDDTWITIGHSADEPKIAFQRAPNLHPPQWPDERYPQQMHLDLQVPDLDEGEREVCALGAVVLDRSEQTFRVFADPAGHPFCLVTP